LASIRQVSLMLDSTRAGFGISDAINWTSWLQCTSQTAGTPKRKCKKLFSSLLC